MATAAIVATAAQRRHDRRGVGGGGASKARNSSTTTRARGGRRAGSAASRRATSLSSPGDTEGVSVDMRRAMRSIDARASVNGSRSGNGRLPVIISKVTTPRA